MDSILTTIKKMLGIAEDYTHFDVDIVIDINATLMVLTQLGVGPTQGYLITSAEDEWDDFLDGAINLEAIKTYIYLKVKLMFDPPQTSFAIESANRMITELEWRINLEAERSS